MYAYIGPDAISMVALHNKMVGVRVRVRVRVRELARWFPEVGIVIGPQHATCSCLWQLAIRW